MSSLRLPFDVDHSIAFTSLTMTPLTYLNRLLRRIGELGGHLHRAHLPSLSYASDISITALTGGLPPRAIVVCTGLGSITLGDVTDQAVYPTRGQVVKVRAPWIRDGWTRQVGSLEGGEGGERTYVIPRPDGEVILGGTREEDDWFPYPRDDTGQDILRRAQEICPALPPANTSVSEGASKPGGQGLQSMIISHLVGFRPSRRGGVRLEKGPDLELKGSVAKVIYNYGHGGAGWQSCWGFAEEAVDLVVQHLPIEQAKL